MKVIIYGSDLTAWVAAACLAKAGNNVVIQGPDNQIDKPLQSISAIRDEPGLLNQIERQISENRLSRDISAIDADIHWLALQPNERAAAEVIIDNLSGYTPENLLVVNQCSFGVGATDELQQQLDEDKNQAIVYIPDNLQEGKALQGFSQPERIILGTNSDWALTVTRSLIRPFLQNIEHLQLMTSREAEFTKFATTGMLALRLGYINELANLADQLDVDIDVIRDGMGADPRIGNHYLQPGCGFGGQNFHNYISRFSEIFQKKRHNSLLKTVIDENEIQKELLFRKLWQFYKSDLSGKAVAIWGASFKPGTASIDNAPSLKVIDALLAQGVHVNVHDPEALPNLKNLYTDEPLLSYCDSPYQAAKDCDAVLLITEWPEYWSPDYLKLIEEMRTPLIIDGRNIFDKEALEMYGFSYIGVGR
ncbi:nucleotide sugar dehydrogenase [Amphritea sp. HPY]|uniref:nucleotide sugar dehydrogenase n=1 Tax=Amphritea sp. HPY TaxID=3421652 RepID=UPI003D7E7152